MSTITIKDLPAPLHRELKARAEAHGRSLNTEVISCLETTVQSRPVDVEELLRRARELRASIGGRLTATQLRKLKNAGRA
jgi:plasmid stability protein